MQHIIPTCPNCQTELQQKKGKYGMFWGCPNWADCGFKGYPIKGDRPKDRPYRQEPQNNPQLIVLEELQAGFKETNERLDKLISFVVQKLK